MYEYRTQVVKVVDGDTLRLNVDLGCDVRLNMTVRLYGLNCPELSTPEGEAARDFTAAWLTDHQDDRGVVVLTTIKDKKEKFGRYLGIVSADEVDGRTLNDDLLTAGHATPYSGGKRG